MHGFGPGMAALALAHLFFLGLFVAGVACAIWLVVKKRRGGFPGHGQPGRPCHPYHGFHGAPPSSPAQQILDERLARGEIEVDDYLTRKAALAGDRPNGTEYTPEPPPAPAPEAPPAEG